MKLKALLVAIASLITSTAFAGWVSGGGELIKNKNNPWFIQNTAVVNYCIEQDSRYFTMTPARLDELIHKALGYWKEEFRRAEFWVAPGSQKIELFTQTYVKKSCAEHVDLRFQFGVLSPDQRLGLEGVDPREHVAFTIRTDYDERQLKGRGFLYVTPDNGPERYRGAEYRDGAWHEKDNRYLYEILVHEIGHVYGLTHFGRSFMDESLGEFLVSRQRVFPGPNQPEKATLGFDWRPNRKRCDYADSDLEKEILRDYFAITEDFDCFAYEFTFENNGGAPKTMVLSYSKAGRWHPIGTVEFRGWGGHSTPTHIRLKFKAEQGVFPIDGPGEAMIVAQNFQDLQGWITLANGAKKYVAVDSEPNSFNVTGFVDNRGIRHLTFYAESYEWPRP